MSKDLFSGHASEYARYRPRYPSALFDHLAAATPSHESAWDCGTGNGQAALELATRFQRVDASDLSLEQVAAAPKHPNVTYHVWSADKTELASRSVDLVTVAQALHWFDARLFSEEVRRVTKPGGILAVWCYGLAKIDPQIDAVTNALYENDLGAFWEPERRHVENGYESIPLPIAKESRPEFEIRLELTCEQWMNYLNTWSAVKKMAKLTGRDPVEERADAFKKAWGEPLKARPVVFPISIRMGPVI